MSLTTSAPRTAPARRVLGAVVAAGALAAVSLPVLATPASAAPAAPTAVARPAVTGVLFSTVATTVSQGRCYGLVKNVGTSSSYLVEVAVGFTNAAGAQIATSSTFVYPQDIVAGETTIVIPTSAPSGTVGVTGCSFLGFSGIPSRVVPDHAAYTATAPVLAQTDPEDQTISGTVTHPTGNADPDVSIYVAGFNAAGALLGTANTSLNSGNAIPVGGSAPYSFSFFQGDPLYGAASYVVETIEGTSSVLAPVIGIDSTYSVNNSSGQATVTGTLLGGDMSAHPVSGATVQLLAIKGGSTFVVGSGKTDAKGNWSIKTTPTGNVFFEAYYPGGNGLPSSTSSEVAFTIHPSLTLSVPKSGAFPGSKVKLTGSIKPSLTGVTVLLEKKVGNKYVVVSKALSGKGGTFTFVVGGGRSNVSYRTEVRAVTGSFSAFHSSTTTLKVRKR